jgi:hypothetical protein
MGADALALCPSCGRDNLPEARFRASCGSSLEAQAGPAEGRPFYTMEGERGALRPRGLGELLSETFKVYRRGYRPFVLIALVPQYLSSLPSSGESPPASKYMRQPDRPVRPGPASNLREA